MLTAEQKKARRMRIGASDAAAILGLNRYESPYDIWLDKTGRLEDKPDTSEQRLGHYLEPAILEAAGETLGTIVKNVEVPAPTSLGFPLTATLDGQLAVREPVEAKTAGLENDFFDLSDWGPAGSDEVPQEYLVQVTAQVLCTGTEVAHLWALLRGRGIVPYVIKVPQEIRDQVADRLGAFWDNHVLTDTPPSMDRPPRLEIVKQLKIEPGKEIAGTKVLEALWDRLQTWKDSEKISKDAKEKTQAEILARLDDAESAVMPSGWRLVNQSQTRKAYTREVPESTYRVLRRKAK